jgi:hypothetical protein
MTWTPGLSLDTWEDAEDAAAWHMVNVLGFADAHRAPHGPDNGVDVRSSWAIAQVKHKRSRTGRPAIQQLVGARGRWISLIPVFYSTSGYAKPAVTYAFLNEVALFTMDPFGRVQPANYEAESLTISARARLKRARHLNERPLDRRVLASFAFLWLSPPSTVALDGGPESIVEWLFVTLCPLGFIWWAWTVGQFRQALKNDPGRDAYNDWYTNLMCPRRVAAAPSMRFLRHGQHRWWHLRDSLKTKTVK